MKVIFSRKGFDQEFGGYPSPLIPGEKIQSFPIPSKTGIHYKNIYHSKKINLKRMMDHLGIKSNKGNLAHLDPDLDPLALSRKRGWRAAFGQTGAAQGHLANKGVGPGDLFLFFGWFRRASLENGRHTYFDRSNLHVLYGYLMVEKVIEVNENSKVPAWLDYHPHCESRLRKTKNNCIYIGKKELYPGVPGYGPLRHSEKLVLTKEGLSRSRWNLNPKIFKGLEISYHSPNSWKEGYFQSAAKGQEFVVEENTKVERWALDLVKKHQV